MHQKIDYYKSYHYITLILLPLLLFFNDCEKSYQAGDFETVKVERRDIGNTVLATGIIKPKVGAEVRVGSRVSGIVKKLYVRIGDQVEKGQLLAELDPTEYQARLNQAVADLENAKANLDYARSDLERQNALLEKNLVSQNEYELAKRSEKVAEAQLKQVQANLNYAQIQLEYTKIKSPILGIVASVFTQEGETVAASFSAPTFVTIIDLTRLEVWAYVDEIDIGRIHEDQEAAFLVDTYPEVEFRGKVTAIFPKAEIQENVVNYITTIEMTDREGKILRPEMTTTVNIFLETHQNVLTVPNGVIRVERGRKYVYVLEQNKPSKRWVKTGIHNEDYTEILDGVEEDEVVVVGKPEPKV
jgi:macrolide-specific efflux system membrane fusion protein